MRKLLVKRDVENDLSILAGELESVLKDIDRMKTRINYMSDKIEIMKNNLYEE